MGMVRVQKDRRPLVVTKTPNECRSLMHAHKVALAFRESNHDRHVQLAGGFANGLEGDQIRNIKMADGNPLRLRVLKHITQCGHLPSSLRSPPATIVGRANKKHSISRSLGLKDLDAHLDYYPVASDTCAPHPL